MKASQYIYIVPYDDDRTIIFCGITKKFLIADKQTLESIVLILRDPKRYNDSHSSLIKILTDCGLLIENNFSEIEYLLNHRASFVNSKEYKSTIIPTFDCNYNCWYCIQKHVKEKISKKKLDLIIQHIKTYILENDITSYILSWFGGEPLME